MLLRCFSAAVRRAIPALVLCFSSGLVAVSPCRAQEDVTGAPVVADSGQDPETPEDANGPSDPVPDPVPVTPLPIGDSTEGIFVVGTGVYQTTLTAVDNLGVIEIALQIKKGTLGGNGITFDTELLASEQKVTATLIGNNMLFITGKVAIAPAVVGGASPRKLVSGILYREGEGGPLKFKGVGFSNAAKAYERLQQEAANQIPTHDPCAEDPDDLSLT